MSKRRVHGRLRKLTFVERVQKELRNQKRGRPKYVYVVTQEGRFRIPRVGDDTPS